MKEATCFLCGKKFLRKKSQLDYHRLHFCSRKCWIDYRKEHDWVDRTCPICEKVARVRKSERTIYCSYSCSGKRQKQLHTKAFMDHDGYWCLRRTMPDGSRGTERVHRLIAEKAMGRKLLRSEVVHHVNMIRADNRHKNLLICAPGFHQRLHTEMARRYAMEHLDTGSSPTSPTLQIGSYGG